MCKVGYGKKSINTHKKGMNDCYIHEYPNQLAYTNREEYKKEITSSIEESRNQMLETINKAFENK